MYVLNIQRGAESPPYFFGGLSDRNIWITDDIREAVLFPDLAPVYSIMAFIDCVSDTPFDKMNPVCVDLEDYSHYIYSIL